MLQATRLQKQVAKAESFSPSPSRVETHPANEWKHTALNLQSAIGNHAVAQLLQESRSASGGADLRAHSFGEPRNSSHPQPMIQRKLTVNAPGDEYEHEADRVADQVMRMPDPNAARTISSTASGLQRKCGCGGTCTDCKNQHSDDEHAHVQMKASGPGSMGGGEAPPIVHEVLNSPGEPLDAETRTFMDSRFGQDFSGVRVHADGKAAESARAVQAKAYTVGGNIVFGAGQYEPTSPTGKSLLAHELTHTVQQNHGSTSAMAGGQVHRAPLKVQRQHESEVHASPPAGVPFEKWGPSVEGMYRRNGLDFAANAVARCRQGDCAKLLTEQEAYEAYRTGRLSAGMGEASQKDAKSPGGQAAPLVAGAAVPLVSPGAGTAGAAGQSALERAAIRWGTAEVIEGGGAAAAPGAAGIATVAVPVALGIYVVVATIDLINYASFQVALQRQGYVILPNPLQVCISGCHQPAAPTFQPKTPFFPTQPLPRKLPYAPFPDLDEKRLRDWLEPKASKKQTQPDPQVTPQPTPQTKPEPKPKDKQKECFERLPYALPCEDEISRDEQVLEFIMRQGYSYESLGECTLMGAVDKVDACNGAPGESWHCNVSPYFDPISKKKHPGGVVSIFSCVCCRKDGDTGFEWRGQHWSPGKF